MGHLLQLLSVIREYLGLGHETHICPILIHYRQIPGLSCLKLLHYTIHLLIQIDICWSRQHKVIHMKCIIQVLLEHIPPDIFQRNIPLKMIAGI